MNVSIHNVILEKRVSMFRTFVPGCSMLLPLQCLFISITCQNFAKIVTEISPLQNIFMLLFQSWTKKAAKKYVGENSNLVLRACDTGLQQNKIYCGHTYFA